MPANIERARRLLAEAGVDFVLSATLENSYYLSGIWNFGQEIFPHDDQFYVLAPASDVTAGVVVISAGMADLAVEAYRSITDVVTFGGFVRAAPDAAPLTEKESFVKAVTIDRPPAGSAFDALVQAFAVMGCTKGVVAVDERGPDRDLVNRLRAAFPGIKFVAGTNLFRKIRMVKTPAEVEFMISALRANEAGIRAVCAAAATGVTERELQLAYRQGVLAAGGFPGICLLRFGRGMALGQVTPGEDELRPGDYIFMDVGATYKGYRSDIGRVAAYGEPSKKLRDLQRASLAGQSTAIEMMRPGMMPGTIFDAAVKAVRQAGIPHYERHHVGHGIGIEWYDAPSISPGVTTPLETGMVFEVETPYYELGFGGAFNEDTVVIQDEGAQILTELDRGLLIVPVQ